MFKLLVLSLVPVLVTGQREGPVVNRRARQRISQPRKEAVTAWGADPTSDYSEVKSSDNSALQNSDYSSVTSNDKFDYRPVQNDYRPVQRTRARYRSQTTAVALYSEPTTVQYRENTKSSSSQMRRARLPRRRGGGTEVNHVEERPRSRPRSRSRARSRSSVTVPSVHKELNRDERGGLETTRSSVRSRSRTRYRRPNAVTTESYQSGVAKTNSDLSYRGSRLRSRGRASSSSSRYRPEESSFNERPQELRSQGIKESRSQNSGPRILFPKLNLFSSKPKVSKATHSSQSNSLDSTRTESKPSRGRNRDRKDEIRPTKPLRSGYEDEYQIQSSYREETQTVPTEITVTHQVPSRTVFTVIERGETKSLFADTYLPSLEVIPVTDLQSTEINSQRVVYAHVKTNMPNFGVTELEFEAIQPTRTYSQEERSLIIGGSRTTITDSIPYTVYNVETLTTRSTQTPSLNPGSLGIESLGDHGQLGVLLQNVLLSILGGNLLGQGGVSSLQGAPQTQFITHTRSFLTTTTTLETIVIPINFRGSKIFETVTDLKTSLITTTDTSVQTVLTYSPNPAPFLPLAPTLHRAARVVPVSPPPLNLPIIHTSPPQLQTSILTQTETVTSTLTTFTTSQILLTLGGREITTEIVEPHTQVVTSTVLSTQSVLVAEARPPADKTIRRLQLLRALLRLRS